MALCCATRWLFVFGFEMREAPHLARARMAACTRGDRAMALTAVAATLLLCLGAGASPTAITGAFTDALTGRSNSLHSSNNRGLLQAPSWHGLTLVHFSAQLERFVWDRGCA
jgi:hypothetical protein